MITFIGDMMIRLMLRSSREKRNENLVGRFMVFEMVKGTNKRDFGFYFSKMN
jgi:hypothetical protein